MHIPKKWLKKHSLLEWRRRGWHHRVETDDERYERPDTTASGYDWDFISSDCFAEMAPCPLSAKLYQAQKVGTVSTEEQLKLVRKAAKEVRKPHPELRCWGCRCQSCIMLKYGTCCTLDLWDVFLFQGDSVARAHREKAQKQAKVSVQRGFTSSHTQPFTCGRGRRNTANGRGTSCRL